MTSNAFEPSASAWKGSFRVSPEMAGAFLTGIALVVALNFRHAPFNNEFLYLIYPYRWSHPSYIATDWTLAAPEREHLIFNLIAGTLLRFIPPITLLWIGRLVCWMLLISAWLRATGRLGIRPVLAILALAIWQGAGQSLFGGEWLFQTFESKVVAYVFVLFALDQLFLGNDRRAGGLLGIAFSLHPAVGLSCALASGVGYLFLGRDRRRLLRFAAAGIAGALPGAVVALPLLLQSAGPGGDMWQVMVHAVLPMHLDPASWPRGSMALAALMLAFNILQVRQDAPAAEWRFLLAFECALAGITTFGFIVYATGHYSLLAIYPFRVFPLLITPCFLLHFFRAFRNGQLAPSHPVLSLCALITIFKLPDHSLYSIPWIVADRISEWSAPEADADRAYAWIREHTPADAVVASPPWLKESFYLSERAQVGSLFAVVNDRLPEWRARTEILIGPLSAYVTRDRSAMQRHFDHLAVEDIATMRRRYGATLLLTRGSYALPRLHREGEYSVYDLGPASVKPEAVRR